MNQNILIKHLKETGVLVISVGNEGKAKKLVRVHKGLDDELDIDEYPGFVFVPLR